MRLRTCRTAELCSRHITESDAAKLAELEASHDVVVAGFDTGWFVVVGDMYGGDWSKETDQSLREFYECYEFSPEFLAIVRAAQEQGMAYIHFHAYAEPTEGLATFEW